MVNSSSPQMDDRFTGALERFIRACPSMYWTQFALFRVRELRLRTHGVRDPVIRGIAERMFGPLRGRDLMLEEERSLADEFRDQSRALGRAWAAVQNEREDLTPDLVSVKAYVNFYRSNGGDIPHLHLARKTLYRWVVDPQERVDRVAAIDQVIEELSGLPTRQQ